MEPKDMQELIDSALLKLGKAMTALYEETVPQTPMPRPPKKAKFYSAGVRWPSSFHQLFHLETARDEPIHLMHLEDDKDDKKRRKKWVRIMVRRDCQNQPRKVLALLRGIRSATDWCEARRRGRERAAAEIRRQQREHIRTLEAELAVHTLGQKNP